jgi:predicted Rossmann fold flavoprotein
MIKGTLAVIGGGAAGFFAAIHAAENFPQLRVILLEKTDKLLAKVRISGGGRCNVTHHCFQPNELSKNYPRGSKALRGLFFEFGPEQTIKWFEKQDVPIKTEDDGRMFPVSNQSESIIQALLEAASKASVRVKMKTVVQKLTPHEGGFLLDVGGTQPIDAQYVIVASGGSPKASQLQWLADLGHQIAVPVPSLFTFNLKDPLSALMGVSCLAKVQIQGFPMVVTGPLLITHWGFSGPPVLKLSAFAARWLHDANYQYNVRIQWLPKLKEPEIRQQLSGQQRKPIQQHKWHELPKRLWQFLLEKAGLRHHLSWPELNAKEQNRLVSLLIHDTYPAQGKTTFKEEFVTAGGIDLQSVNMKTLESKVVPGLFFAGEVLDIDGVTGGFNFQAAWTTGFKAAQLGQKIST